MPMSATLVRAAVLVFSAMALLVSAVVSATAVGARLEGVEGVEAGVVVVLAVASSFLPEEAAAMAPTPTATAPTAAPDTPTAVAAAASTSTAAPAAWVAVTALAAAPAAWVAAPEVAAAAAPVLLAAPPVAEAAPLVAVAAPLVAVEVPLATAPEAASPTGAGGVTASHWVLCSAHSPSEVLTLNTSGHCSAWPCQCINWASVPAMGVPVLSPSSVQGWVEWSSCNWLSGLVKKPLSTKPADCALDNHRSSPWRSTSTVWSLGASGSVCLAWPRRTSR